MFTTVSKVGLFVAVAMIASLLLALNISKSNAKVLALSVLKESGEVYHSQGAVVFVPRGDEMTQESLRAITFLERSFEVRVER